MSGKSLREELDEMMFEIGVPPFLRAELERRRKATGASDWRELVIAHRKTGQVRPLMDTVATNMEISEQTLRKRIRKLGFERWYDVHAAVAAESE